MKHLNFKAIFITAAIFLSLFFLSNIIYVHKDKNEIELVDYRAQYVSEKKAEAKEIIESPNFKTSFNILDLTELLIYMDSLCFVKNVDYNYVKAIISQESRWNPNAINNTYNARGLMQVTPIGAKSVDKKHGDLQYDPRYNVETGIEMLSSLFKLTGSMDKTLVSYASGYSKMKKSGPGYVKNHSYLKLIKKWLDFFEEV
jgi:hypothetical protein